MFKRNALFPAAALAVLALGVAPCPAAGIDTLVKEMAEEIGQRLKQRGVEKVAVLEFSNGNDSLGGDAGAAGKLLANFTARSLANVNGKSYALSNSQRTRNALKECGFRVEDLGKPDRLACLGSRASADAVVTGKLWRWQGTVYVTMAATELGGKAEEFARQDREMPFTHEMAGLVGENFIRPPSAPEAKAEEAIQLAAVKHPVLDRTPEAPPEFEMRVLVGGRPLPLYSEEGSRDVWAPAREGQAYEVELVNNSDGRVGVVLLIDGLNFIGGERVSPGPGAKKWLIHPGRTKRVPGWQQDMETARRFVFVPGSESLAARQGYAGEIGLITAVFYRERSSSRVKSRGIGTGEGDEVESRARNVDFDAEQSPSAAISIRYDRADIVERMPRVP